MSDDSDEQLEQRVNELEQTVSKMLPDRRGVLKGLGAAALGGAAVGGATGGASGQSASGTIGTESEPVDVITGDLDVGSLTSESVHTGKLRTNDPRVKVIDPTNYDTVSGTGTAASPWTHNDGTAGIQAAINSFEAGRGGVAVLPVGEYDITTTIQISKGSQRLAGDIAGYNKGAPPRDEADVGTKLDLNTGVDGIRIDGSGLTNTRNRNTHLEQLYIYGSKDQRGVSIRADGVEQNTFEDLHIHSCDVGVYVDAQADGSRIKDTDIQDCNTGIVFDVNATTQYVRVIDCDVSVITGFPIAIDPAASEGALIINQSNFIGNDKELFIGNDENLIGDSVIAKSNGNGIHLAGNGNVLANCTIRNNASNGVRVSGLRNRIDNCVFNGNSTNIRVESGATETIISGIGYEGIVDNGTRTVAAGVSVNTGNPSVNGQWAGNADTALILGVETVWDTSVDPPVAYAPHPDAGSGAAWRTKNFTSA